MLIRLLEQAARTSPDTPLVMASDGETTYADCQRKSRLLANGLHARSLQRVGCLVANTADLVALLAGASAAGCEPCVYPANVDESSIDDLAAAFQHDVVVTDREIVLSNATAVGLAELPAEEPSLAPSSLAPSSLAPLMILTTGTTGRPKGARYDWSRLVETAEQRTTGAGERWLLAYNLNQFAGIQVLLHVMASQATLLVPDQRQPRSALEAMRRWGVTHASATPTFWRFLLALLDRDAAAHLPLRQITLGGEPVPGQLLDELRTFFPQARISHVYASTEFGSTISVHDGRPGLPLSVLDRPDDAEVQLRIEDGQLHARSRVGMTGYHGQTVVDAGQWRPTGDMVEVRDDRIYFVGRITETINVGGVKVHPLPVEELVTAVRGVQMAHAYGRKNPLTGQIVAVDVVAAPGESQDDLEDAIRAACESLPPPAQPRRIRFVEQIEVNEQKVARRPVPTQ